MSEYVYILSNSSMPGMIKIGRTNRHIDERIYELSSATGVPTPFILEHVFETFDSSALEYLIHKDLESYRISDKREFFQISPQEAIEHISKNYLTRDSSDKAVNIVLLHLQQGRWEVNNLPKERRSIKASYYEEYVVEKKKQEIHEEEMLIKFCDFTIFEVDNYPRELWSPTTIILIEYIEDGNIEDEEMLNYKNAYLNRRKNPIINREARMKLYEEFGFTYTIDDQGKEVSPFSVKHPDFHGIMANSKFIQRIKNFPDYPLRISE